MPFSKYDVPPAQIEAMRSAFHRVCDALQLNCGVEDPVTELVVLKIVELAKTGEDNPDQLCAAVLAELDTQPQRAAGSSAAHRNLVKFVPEEHDHRHAP
jgi:hypothetical protein